MVQAIEVIVPLGLLDFAVVSARNYRGQGT